jgi:hypothetical protein
MVGLPLVPCHQFPTNAPAAIFPLQAWADTNLSTELSNYVKTGRPVFLTDSLDQVLPTDLNLHATNVNVARLPRPLDYLLAQPQTTLDEVRAPLLEALHVSFRAPGQVALYLFSPNGWVIENFNDKPVAVVFKGQKLNIPARGWLYRWE